MNKEIFKNTIIERFSKYGLILSSKNIDEFYNYMKNLCDWNSKINLTAIKNEEEIIVKHFLDSSIIIKYFSKGKILDVGAGAGLPGIPLKIMNKDLEVTLLDSVNKKVNFMKDSIEKLELSNTVAIHGRAEDFAHEKKYREKFDIVVSRAVSNMSTLAEYMIPFVKVGGKCICMKGPSIESELQEAKNAIKKLGGEIVDVVKYNVENNERTLIIILKKKNTEQTYPRKQGKPLKEPIK